MDGLISDRLGRLGAAFCIVLLVAMFLPVVTINVIVSQSVRGLDVAGFWALVALVLGALVVMAPKVAQIAQYRNLFAMALGGFLAVGVIYTIYVLVRIRSSLGQFGMGMGDMGDLAGDAIRYGYLGILAIVATFVLGFLVAAEGWKRSQTAPAA